MIKKFKLFINETNSSIKKEYQILSLNKEEKINYFILRLNQFKEKELEFLDYEFDLCPAKIKKEYIEICVEKGMGLDDDKINNLNSEQKQKYIINLYIEGLPNDMFDNLSEDLKMYYINKKINHVIQDMPYSYHPVLTDEEFEWCSDELKLKYIQNILYDSNPENMDYMSEKEFEWCSDELRIEYINKLLNDNISLNVEKFQICSDNIKKYYIDKLFENFDEFSDELFNSCSEELKKYFLKLTLKLNTFELTNNQKEFLLKNNL